MQLTKTEIKARIIRKLVQWRKWGGSHTENILKGLPSHLRGAKITKEALHELERDEWIIPAKKTGEIHYSLNVRNPLRISEHTRNSKKISKCPKKTDEILCFYEKYCNR